MNQLERYRGCLLGLALGDALGTTLEFHSPGSFRPIKDMTGGGPFNLKAGEWTDDTSMALCLADSLIERKGFDLLDQMESYGAVYGQLAGAFYGEEGIPAEWKSKLALRETIELLAERLFELSRTNDTL